jgi:hypothetical protein
MEARREAFCLLTKTYHGGPYLCADGRKVLSITAGPGKRASTIRFVHAGGTMSALVCSIRTLGCRSRVEMSYFGKVDTLEEGSPFPLCPLSRTVLAVKGPHSPRNKGARP